jgi:hypothetical protein
MMTSMLSSLAVVVRDEGGALTCPPRSPLYPLAPCHHHHGHGSGGSGGSGSHERNVEAVGEHSHKYWVAQLMEGSYSCN